MASMAAKDVYSRFGPTDKDHDKAFTQILQMGALCEYCIPNGVR